MAVITLNNTDRYGYDFIPSEYLPNGKDEYWLRNTQVAHNAWRTLSTGERETLIKNNNICSAWDNFLVTDPFDPSLIRDSRFYGLVRIGAMRNVLLKHHDFCIPAGIRNSTIISCDIGNDCAIQDCSYISHYIIGDTCILSRIDEMQTTNHAKFGSGVLKDGEGEDKRIWIDVMNEAGGRSILPFQDMLCADAFLWSCYRDDTALCEALKNITQKEYGKPRGMYGVVGSNSTIKSCLIIKNVFVGECAYIKGANKLKNISILSSKEEPTQIGEGVEMVNGIVGYGCNVFYGSKAVRFVMGSNSNLKYGARLIHSVLGDNSTVSCCEILNSFIFPAHEQHHNNSFLIAVLLQGISNLSAGATVGSNHNSRTNDGEIHAKRGFWAGLSTTLKHSSFFASYVLLVKGDYPRELNITLPFSLVSNNVRLDRLEVMPAFFWMHNIYALERNSWKTQNRDMRKIKKQFIETDYLAPDTAEEIISSLTQMELWMKDLSDEDDLLQVTGLEPQRRSTTILKPREAFAAYREMLLYYSLKTLACYLEQRPELSYKDFVKEMEKKPIDTGSKRISEWINLGGQIVPAFRVDELRDRIGNNKIDSWEKIHTSYIEMADVYALDKAQHAWETYRFLENEATGTEVHAFEQLEVFKREMETHIKLCSSMRDKIYLRKVKDLNDQFRAYCYRNTEEMKQVLGNAEDNSFIKHIRKQTELREASIRKLIQRL